MPLEDTGTRPAPGTVRVRAEGDVGARDLACVRSGVGAVLGRSGLPAVSGDVRITRAAAPHAGPSWSAGAEIRVGDALVVVHAREAGVRALADRLQDRLRGQVERVVYGARTTRRPAAPPWYGGPAGEGRTALAGGGPLPLQ
ncbi:hypothetical protein [Streptomyces viridosporus]|uniref:hypothetical protein n=1 Tax=Streptomyces viridosporus TaxID=67581 RepID=UPI0009BEE010|nr:hypothetical protein [Streptomyces viridosporus]